MQVDSTRQRGLANPVRYFPLRLQRASPTAESASEQGYPLPIFTRCFNHARKNFGRRACRIFGVVRRSLDRFFGARLLRNEEAANTKRHVSR